MRTGRPDATAARTLIGVATKTLKIVALMLFAPSRFGQLADEEARRLGQDSRPAGDPQFVRAGRDIRRALGQSLALVMLAVIAGVAVARVLRALAGAPAPLLSSVLQYVGIGLLLWATLAKQGWNIQTFNGNTLPERLDRLIYRTFYVTGSFLLVLAVAW